MLTTMLIVLHNIVDISVDRQVNDTLLCQVELQPCTSKLKHESCCVVIIIRVSSNTRS